MPLRTIFFGTAELACASLSALAGDPALEVVAVVTQPDRPKGRTLRLSPSPVKVEAQAHQLDVLQPERARAGEFVESVSGLRPDVIVVAAYGQILPQSLLDQPRFGCLNVHTSLLPKYRGAAPIQWAILNDEPETGVTIMKMDAGLDTGDILTQEVTLIEASDNAQTLHDRLAAVGAKLLIETIPRHVAGELAPRPQPAECASYARKLTKQDGQLDWRQPARAVWNRVRALTPWPGAFTFVHTEGSSKPPILKIWQADVATDQSGEPGTVLRVEKSGIVVACADQSLRLQVLQREGGRRLSVQEFLTGHALTVGQKLG